MLLGSSLNFLNNFNYLRDITMKILMLALKFRYMKTFDASIY